MDGGRPPVIEAQGVTRILPGEVPVTLVRDIDLAIAPGEFLSITGPSGSGKSSLLYLLGLLDRPTMGTIRLEGTDTAGLDSPTLARMRLQHIGFVFQFHFLLPEFTVLENIMIPMRRLGGEPPGEMRSRAEALLAGLGLSERMARTPDRLSGGERQRVAIARALANRPTVLLADEPTGNLDTRNGEIVIEIFLRLSREQGHAIAMVTHDAGFADRADRRIHLVDGRITDRTASAA